MADDLSGLDQAISQVQGTPPDTQPTNSLDAAIAQVQGEKQAHTAATVRNNLQFATSAVPDQEARVRHLARFLDQPLETVRSDTDTAHAQAVLKATDADRMAVEHPATAAALGDPSTARMLHDDIPNVAATESIVGKLTKLRDYVFGSSRDPNDPSMAGDIYRSAVGGLSTTAKYLNLAGGVVPIGLDRLKESVTGQHTTELEDPYFASMVAPADANQQNAQLPEHAPIYRKASAAVGQLASMLAQAASTGGGAPAVEGAQTMQQFLTEALAHTTKAMMLPAASQGMQTGENVQQATGDTGAAIRAGLAQYLVSTAQGLAPLSATGGLATRVTTGAISGVAGGQAGRIAMNAVLPEGMQQPFDPEQAVVDSIIGGGMGGVLGPRTPPEWLKAVRQTYVDSAKAEHAAQAMGLLQELSAVATAGKFRERDQQAFHDFMSEANGPDLYVDARTFAQTLDQSGITAEQLQAKLPDAAAQMREGLQSDGMVRIPMADYATHIAGGPADAALLPHLRTDPEGMTFDEAQKFTTEQAGKMSEQATQLATGEDQSAAAAFRASGDEVQKKVKAQLDEAGHFPSPVNDAYASLHRAFFDTLAARLGITPEEAHAQFPLEVGSEALGTGAMGQTATVRSGKETLEAFGLDPNGKYNTRDIAAALEARQRALYGKIEPTDRSSEAADRIANWMAEEVRFEMQHPRKSGVGWYSTKFQRALDKFADAFPELKDDAAARAIPGIKNAKDARGLLTALIAVTSDGQKVVPNFRMAADLYRSFRETGTFSTERGHARMDSIDGNVGLIQELHTRLGASEMRKYLLQEATVSDLRKIAKAKGIEFKTEYQAHVKLPMAAVVFGPKLGAFYANLMGAHGYLTMDRWWSRTFNRYRGTLLQAPTADGLARIKELMGHPEWSDDQALAATVEPRNAYAKKNFKNGTELEKAANTVYKAGFENLEDAPFNATDRTFMLGAVARAQEILAAEGRKMSVADIQAVLWYYEKRLYGELGARQSADVSYEEAAQRVTAEHLSAGESGRPGAPGAGEGASGLDAEGLARPGDEGSTPGLDPFEPNAARRVLNQAAFHGSPHDFDRFDLGKIGTGEGAQAYGHGLYFAENKSVAEGYRKTLSARDELANWTPELRAKLPPSLTGGELGELGELGRAMQKRGNLPSAEMARWHELNDKKIAYAEAVERLRPKGGLYTVDIPDEHVANFLHWDKPLSEQPEGVRKAVAGLLKVAKNADPAYSDEKWLVGNGDGSALGDAVGAFATKKEAQAFIENATGRQLYTALAATRSPRGASAFLNEHGVKGIKYLDGGSRGAGDGTHNLVVFDDSIVKVTHKDGTPVSDAERSTFLQGGDNRLGEISFGNDIQNTPSKIALFKNANLSTFLHESGHFFLEIYADLAGRADAPPEIKADLQKVLDWFGVKDLDAWKALTPEQKEPFHEQFARGFEARLMEGNAPSAQLSGLFARFRSWLVNVYKSLANLHVDLSDEVRGVMDRMVASDEAIRQQEQVRGMEAMFTEKPEGMSDAEFAAYRALGEQASEKASSALQDKSLRDMKWLSNAKSKAVRELQAQAKDAREAMQAEVTKEVDANPAFQAKAFLDEATASSPESKAQVKEWQAQRGVAEDAFRKEERERAADGKKGLEKGQAIAKAKRAIDNAVEARMLEWEVQHPKPTLDRGDINHDIVAERFGFSSGDEMLQAIHAAGNRADIIKAMTDQRMLQQYGELTTPEGIQRAAEQAIHNDVRARFIATELNALAKATGSPALLARAARDAAHAAIAAKKVRDLRPDQYTAAEGKASRESTAALKKGDIPVAAAKKRAQLLSNALAKAALEARAEITKGVAYLKKFDKASIRANLSQDFLSQIDSLLERYDLRQATGASIDKKASLRSFVQARLNAGEMPIPVRAETLLPPKERAAYEAQIASRDAEGNLVYAEPEEQIKLLAEALDRSARMPHQEMTVESFRGLVDTVKTLEHLARQQNKLLTAETERSYQEIRDEMAGSINEHARNSGKGTRTATSLVGRALQAVREFGAAHIKAATWARIMDGGKDNGAVWRYLIRPANDAATFETTRRAEATQALSKILRPILDKVSSVDKMGKGKFFPELGTSLNWQERFAMALNYGNEGNLQRLLGGGIAGVKQRLTPEQIIPVLRSLTAKEWHAVQAVWDHLETYRPEVGALERRMNGTEPDWVEPRPFKITTADGETITLRGGYFPIVYDPRGSLHAQQHSDAADAKQMMKAAYSAAVTQHGFTKNRAEEVNGRPLMLSLQGLYRGVNDVIHDLAWREWVRDANKLLRSKTIDAQIRDHYGPEVKRQLEKWRDDIVTGTRRLDHQIERAAGFLRQGVSAAGLTFNIMSAAMQPLGLTQSIVRIGPQWVGKGLAKYIAAPIEATREANEKSEWMANRMRTRFRELNELANAVHGQTKPRELMGRYGYWMMLRAQQMVDVPTWHGAYEKAVASGENEHDAVRLADQAVKDAQGGGEEVDQAGIERGGPLVKLFTTFYGFMNTAANLGYMQLKTERSAAKLAVQMLLLYTVPAILGDLMKDALTPGDSGKWDEEHVATTLGKSQLSYLFGLVAFGRELGGMVSGQDYTGPAGLRVFADAYKLEKQAQQGEFDDAFRKAVVAEMGDLFGLPGAQINKTITGAEALDEGETDNPAALLLGYQQPH
jgi:hypothetical protein